MTDPALAALLDMTQPLTPDTDLPGSAMVNAAEGSTASTTKQLLSLLRVKMDRIAAKIGLPCGGALVIDGDMYACTGESGWSSM